MVTKNKELSFGVDKTLPNIAAANLENGKTYAVESMTAEIIVRDNLKLAKVVFEFDGKQVKVWEGKELSQVVDGGENFKFEILGDSTSAHELVVYAVDAAGNSEKISVENFYVTTNLWVRYYNNKPLFYRLYLRSDRDYSVDCVPRRTQDKKKRIQTKRIGDNKL